MNTLEIVDLATRRACDYRNIVTLVTKREFEGVFESLTDQEKLKVRNLVFLASHEALKIWFRSKLHQDLGDKNVRELREIASTLKVPDYTRLPKSLLLSEIMRLRNVIEPDKASP